jgi:hypothetical protein
LENPTLRKSRHSPLSVALGNPSMKPPRSSQDCNDYTDFIPFFYASVPEGSPSFPCVLLFLT